MEKTTALLQEATKHVSADRIASGNAPALDSGARSQAKLQDVSRLLDRATPQETRVPAGLSPEAAAAARGEGVKLANAGVRQMPMNEPSPPPRMQRESSDAPARSQGIGR